MKKWIIKITCIIIAVIIGGAASYLLVAKGMKWPAGILGLTAVIGMFVLPRFGCCCHRNNPIFWPRRCFEWVMVTAVGYAQGARRARQNGAHGEANRPA